MTPIEIFDSNLLHLIEGWSDLYDQMMDAALHIPDNAFDLEDEDGIVCPELAQTRALEYLTAGLLRTARVLINEAEEAGLISTDDWRIINHILWYAGSDEPLEGFEDGEEYLYD